MNWKRRKLRETGKIISPRTRLPQLIPLQMSPASKRWFSFQWNARCPENDELSTECISSIPSDKCARAMSMLPVRYSCIGQLHRLQNGNKWRSTAVQQPRRPHFVRRAPSWTHSKPQWKQSSSWLSDKYSELPTHHFELVNRTRKIQNVDGQLSEDRRAEDFYQIIGQSITKQYLHMWHRNESSSKSFIRIHTQEC